MSRRATRGDAAQSGSEGAEGNVARARPVVSVGGGWHGGTRVGDSSGRGVRAVSSHLAPGPGVHGTGEQRSSMSQDRGAGA